MYGLNVFVYVVLHVLCEAISTYSDAFCDKNTVLKAFGNEYIALQYLAFGISSAGFQASFCLLGVWAQCVC